jgi:Mycothiol maleylpyruvate isomerase N-terminal domain
MASDVHERNRAATDRIRAIGKRLSDEELARTFDPPWTTASLLAHVGFWDRFVQARWRRALETRLGQPEPIEDAPIEMLNDAALPEWALIPARAAADECVRAADEIDRFIASLDADTVARLEGSDRRRLVDRSLHRGEHLEAIERAFPDR